MSTAHGVDMDRDQNVQVETTIEVDPGHTLGGWWELYDLESGGQRFYGSGILEIQFNGNRATLVGYDGCHELPSHIVDTLQTEGVNIDL